MKKTLAHSPEKNPWPWAAAFLAVLLAAMFWRSFLPGYVHFSNDGPLGQENWDWVKEPAALFGMWDDANDVGSNAGAASPNISALLTWLLGPVGYSKFLAPVALFIMGLGAWTFFRALKFSPLAALGGALAALLSSTFFGGACWGIAAVEIAMGFNFFALALVVSNHAGTPWPVRASRLALAGLCVGLNVMEAADVGALCSLVIAGFVFFRALAAGGGNIFVRTVRGGGAVALVAVFAGFIACQTIISLVGTSITGVAGTAQDAATKAAHWDGATQWSMPKKETLGLVVPGLFGYKMDTPNGMMPAVKAAYEGGAYWGGVGRDPAIDRYLETGGTQPPAGGFMRFTGGGNYCGILVLLIAAWAVAQSFRRQSSVFSDHQKTMVWFWAAVAAVSVPLMWGRFAPLSETSDSPLFYALLYKLPYFSTIRNPCKFVIFIAWATAILFAYGLHGLGRHLDAAAAKSSDLAAQLKKWWAKASAFDRKWTLACAGIFGASLLGWLVYAAQNPSLVQYLQKMGFPDENFARQIAAFSRSQAGWFILLFAAALALLTLVLAGYFTGPRARLGAMLLGGFLIFDLGRADLPYIIHWDYREKYEIGALNPIVDFLREKPYEHRVATLPFEAQQPLRGYDNTFGGSGIYRIEWMQHHFPYYNIQCLDLIQMPRMPEDLKNYLEALQPRAENELPRYARRWQLTNTRYLLGAAGFLPVLNQQLDPRQQSFRIAQRFDIIPKPGVTQPSRLEELTAQPAADGELALFEFTGALPRAKLYANWSVNTNDAANLKTLADPDFDPAKTVLVSTPGKNLPAGATNENNGRVEFKSYAPKQLVFTTAAATPAILLLNDKYDLHWRVTVDGQPAALLRCNYLMRGVALAAGAHTVAFDFRLPSKPLYVTFTAIGIGIMLLFALFFATRREPAAA